MSRIGCSTGVAITETPKIGRSGSAGIEKVHGKWKTSTKCIGNESCMSRWFHNNGNRCGIRIAKTGGIGNEFNCISSRIDEGMARIGQRAVGGVAKIPRISITVDAGVGKVYCQGRTPRYD